MPSLITPTFPPLIGNIPVADHSVAVDATYWLPVFTKAGQSTLGASIFPTGTASVRISRKRLLQHPYPTLEQKCAEILLWGYPTDQRGIVSRLLPQLRAIAAAAPVLAPAWPDYFDAFDPVQKIGVSTITKLAYFFGITIGGHSALILDSRIIANSARWAEAAIPGLNYTSAPNLYPSYLAQMHGAAAKIGCTPEQLEFFLFALGDSF